MGAIRLLMHLGMKDLKRVIFKIFHHSGQSTFREFQSEERQVGGALLQRACRRRKTGRFAVPFYESLRASPDASKANLPPRSLMVKRFQGCSSGIK